ncbi:MAG: class I SAM-dependent methyltransferase [Acidimicrobiia bacterium]
MELASRRIALSIVVLADDAVALAETLESIEGQDTPELIETIVVLRPGVDAHDLLTGRFPGIRYIEADGSWSSGVARNAGAAVAEGDVVAFLEPRSRVLPGWVRARLDSHRRGHSVVAGAVRPAKWCSPATLGLHYLTAAANLATRPSGAAAIDDHVRESSFARAALERIGAFAEHPGADPELAMIARAGQLGYEVWFNPSIVVERSRPCTTFELLRLQHRRGAQAFFGSDGARDRGASSLRSIMTDAWRWSGYRRWKVVLASPWIAAGAWARRIGWARARAATPPGRRTEIGLSYPTSARNEPRYGYARRSHTQLEELLAKHVPTYRAALARIATYAADLAAIPARGPAAHWDNPWITGLDAASLYAFLRDRRPARYIEVGSGHSTWFAARARVDGSLATDIISIDPSPRRDVVEVCDALMCTPLEDADLSIFDDLQAGDLVFIDSSHRVFMNSDVVAFYLDVLPRLRSGVLVGVHDIYWPDDYPSHLAPAYLSEQYLLGAYLLAETPWIRPVFACHFVTTRPELRDAVDAVWAGGGMPAVDRGGSAFWFAVDHERAG